MVQVDKRSHLVLFQQNQRNHDPYTCTVKPLWKGQECLTKVAKFGLRPCTILYKSCLFYPSWQATSFERPPSWAAFIEGFHFRKPIRQTILLIGIIWWAQNFNSNSKSNSGSFNSNSNSGKSLEYQLQLQLREFQLQLQLRQVSWISTSTPTPTPEVSTPIPTPTPELELKLNPTPTPTPELTPTLPQIPAQNIPWVFPDHILKFPDSNFVKTQPICYPYFNMLTGPKLNSCQSVTCMPWHHWHGNATHLSVNQIKELIHCNSSLFRK